MKASVYSRKLQQIILSMFEKYTQILIVVHKRITKCSINIAPHGHVYKVTVFIIIEEKQV